MATNQDLISAGEDALALTRFVTAPSETPNLNSAGNDIGTLGDLRKSAGVMMESLEALLTDLRTFEPGTLIHTMSPAASYKVMDSSVAAHLTTAGGVALWHVDGP